MTPFLSTAMRDLWRRILDQKGSPSRFKRLVTSFSLVFAQGAPAGYILHYYLFDNPEQISFLTFVEDLVVARPFDLIYIWGGTTFFFGSFGLAMGHMIDKLVRWAQLKERFLAMATHDLRSPLSTIFTISETAVLFPEKTKTIAPKLFQSIKDRASFSIQLLNDLMDFSQTTAPDRNEDYIVTPLDQYAQGSVSQHQQIAKNKGVNLKLTVCAETLTVRLHKTRFEQVLNNLLSNAIKFSKQKGRVDVRVYQKDGSAVVEVRDNGAGIPENELPLLFKPFSRTSTKATAGEKSTGLGLYIVKRIMDAHRGKIWVNSKPGSGSSFFVSIPLSKSETSDISETKAA